MMESIEEPLAVVRLRWRTAEEGGRRSGAPTAPVYAATCVFPLGGEDEVQPGWPAMADKLSILLEEVEGARGGDRRYKAGFLVPDLAKPFVHRGAQVLVTEGPKVVAAGVIEEVFDI